MHVIALTVGRNVGSIPMPDPEWAEFTSDVSQLVSTLLFSDSDAVEFHLGQGAWGAVREQSYKATALCSHQPAQDAMDRIESACRVLAEKYHQDAIALTIGWSSLIQPVVPLTHVIVNTLNTETDQEVYA